MSKIDQYFYTADVPLGKYRYIDLKKVRLWTAGFATICTVAFLFLDNRDAETTIVANPVDHQTNLPTPTPGAAAASGDFYLPVPSPSDAFSRRGTPSTRQLSASQIVRSSNGALPSGTAIAARLLNRIVTSEARSPVIAEITVDVTSASGEAIPVGTKILGTAQAEPGSDRVQVNFHTLIMAEGSEQPFGAVAVMPDGSNGISGEYHSQILRKESGRFLGNFVGGFSEGFKDREQGRMLPYEPGNLKNAALSGLSESASGQAKAYADEMSNVTPYVTVEPGTSFLVYLEKGISF